ncbi:MAG: 30S ribosomal protein S4 [Candidatus Moranbacteria bacterium RIFCSPHIGHO2_02_FULL_40_12b]|nr:MAG: 30S ribosomal protein S4 [Candidatus Moranbacteria bacterium RIFCSPHIGHO2_02_FULL_40_12b]OGI23073.1 MAG: 30S ribosomal protein S4 [Candidatus Moranbacteria bacterium RIFCSPHIGHO2_12_FULL_40_10]
MARILNSKCKKCRRAGEKLFLKGDRCYSPKCAMIRKPYPPGMHGKRFSRGQSEYGKQLSMKQKIKRIYGIMENQFRKHFKEVRKKKGVLGDMFLARLEMRLDNIIYRIGLSGSRSLARQLVNHGSIKVNGRKVDIPSYEVRVGDVISVSESGKSKNYFKNQLQILKNKKNFPSWINFDNSAMEAKIKSIPKREDTDANVDAQLVVEYYSR